MKRRGIHVPNVVLVAVPIAIAAIVFVVFSRKEPRRQQPTSIFPEPRPRAPDSVSRADFVGAQTCASCHATQFAAWSRSVHGQAGGPPSREQIIAPFNGVPIRFRDAVVIPRVSPQGVYTFTVRQNGVAERVLRVDGVVGKGHLVGGGSQAFFSRFPDGTMRLLPFDFMRREAVWFCNTTSATSGAWTPITPDMSITQCLNWTPKRALGDQFRLETCSSCHGSQIELAFDTASKMYVTSVASLKINCESCHGPGRTHVQKARAGVFATTTDIGMRSLATLGRDASMAVCMQCHSLRNLLKPGYLPGRRFEEHFSQKFGLLSDKAYFVDGRTRRFAYQEGQLSSECTRNGSLKCADCHDPHSQRYRDVNGTPLNGRLDNRQCTSCHASKADPIDRHTRHRPESSGSRCVSCHMPYLQEPLLGDALHFARSDHTIPVPRPAGDSAQGIQNACSQCHRDLPVAKLEAQVVAWYGELKPRSPFVARLDSVLASADPRREAGRALMPDGVHPMAQFAGLELFFETVITPDMRALDPDAVNSLKRLADNDDPDVRALALASLHLARGNDPEVRAFLARQLGQLEEDDGVIRKRWVMALGFRGDLYGRLARYEDAVTSYGKALEIQPEDPALLLQLAIAHMNSGNTSAAIQYVERSVNIERNEPRAYVITGLILERMGELERSGRAFQRAAQMNPHDARAVLYLGNVLFGQHQLPAAIVAYKRAVELDPSLAVASFQLARSYMVAGDDANALRAVRQGLAFAPADSAGRETLGYLERALGGRPINLSPRR